jgi:hypothetical protein
VFYGLSTKFTFLSEKIFLTNSLNLTMLETPIPAFGIPTMAKSKLSPPVPVQPTGNPWEPTPENPATLPLAMPVVVVNIEGPYTERDRKLYAFLVHADQ